MPSIRSLAWPDWLCVLIKAILHQALLLNHTLQGHASLISPFDCATKKLSAMPANSSQGSAQGSLNTGAYFCHYRHIRNCRNLVNKQGAACANCMCLSAPGYNTPWPQGAVTTAASQGNGFYPSSIISSFSSQPVRYNTAVCRGFHRSACRNAVVERGMFCDECVAKGLGSNEVARSSDYPCACVFSHGCNEWARNDGDMCAGCLSKGRSWTS
jgi:hypothetical protein